MSSRCGFLAIVTAMWWSQAPAQQQPRSALIESLEMQSFMPAQVVRIAGSDYAAYELHLTNLRPVDIVLSRVVVRGSRSQVLLDLSGAALAQRLGYPRGMQPKAERVIDRGRRAVLYFWFALPKTSTASQLRHQIDFEVASVVGGRSQSMVDGGVKLERQPQLVLSPPLRGGPWAAVYDPLLVGGHRTVFHTLNGRTRIPARFAVDWVRLEADATHARGKGERISDWYGYGSEVLAVADAVVADARDDMREEVAITAATATQGLENESGNYVVLDLGAGRFATYEHLRFGSVRVKAGDRVRRGQVIAQLGNSGSSSSGPHLHFHVSNAASPVIAEGVPYAFECFEVKGAHATMNDVDANAPWRPVPDAQGGVRRSELPAPNSVVQFDACSSRRS